MSNGCAFHDQDLFRYLAYFESSEHHRLASLGWDYTEKKRNYRRFCQEISNRFLQSCEETKLEDTTTGSVRLAMAFIRPWLHSRVHDDLHTATSKLCALAFNIALWPGRWWAQEHSELWNLIHGMSLSLIEEIHGANDPQHALEVTRLKGVVVELEDAVQRYKKDLESRNSRKPTRFLSPLVIPIPPRGQAPPVVNEPHLTIRHPASQPTPVQVVVPMKTPITPPTSPIRTGFQNTFLHLSPPSTTDHSFSVNTESRHLSPCSEPLTVSEPTTEPSAQDAIPPSPESLCSEISFSIQPSSSLETQRSPLSPTLLQLEEIMITSDSSLEDSEDSCDSFVHNHDDVVLRLPGQRIRLRRAATIMETASCVVTGFFIGAFITLCILSPQRRTLLTHLT
ncbi:hypothetical protein H0H93_009550 [Arthromyces matolae]|nr:hypothetical protein H0H93_009550 [Arthromyces matolae]